MHDHDREIRKFEIRVEFNDAGSFQFVTLPMKMSAIELTRQAKALCDAGKVVGDRFAAERDRDLDDATAAPDNSSAFIGTSDAPKSTVFCVNCSMPPPLPIDW